MAAATSTLEFYVGEDVLVTGSIVDSDADAVDITGWTMTFTIIQGSTTYLTKTVGSGITLSAPTSGTFSITFDAADTSSLADGTYHLLLTRTNSGYSTVLSVGFLKLLSRSE